MTTHTQFVLDSIFDWGFFLDFGFTSLRLHDVSHTPILLIRRSLDIQLFNQGKTGIYILATSTVQPRTKNLNHTCSTSM
jgi:hypothetical protein